MNIRIGGQSTPLYKNIVIAKRDAKAIAKEFCLNGILLSDFYWLKEGTEPDAK